MTYTLAFTERATADITDAFEWYEAQRFGLGDDFRLALNRTFELVQQMRNAGPRHVGASRVSPGRVR